MSVTTKQVHPVPMMEEDLIGMTTTTVYYLMLGYAFCYMLHGTIAGLKAVSDLHPGIWFSWQFFIGVCLVAAAKVEMLAPRTMDREYERTHSAAAFVTRRSGLMTLITTWVRILMAASLLVIDSTYLIIHMVKCFSLDCPTDPAAQCCAEGTLYAVALAGVFLQVVIALAILYQLLRLGCHPTLLIRDPVDIDPSVTMGVNPHLTVFDAPHTRAAGYTPVPLKQS